MVDLNLRTWFDFFAKQNFNKHIQAEAFWKAFWLHKMIHVKYDTSAPLYPPSPRVTPIFSQQFSL